MVCNNVKFLFLLLIFINTLNSGIIFYEKCHFILSKNSGQAIKHVIVFTFHSALTAK